MRQSNKPMILEAAVAVIESDGITALTFDSVAAASGLTRGGIIYHFASREDLIGAIHHHLAHRWEAQLEAACGKPAEQATPRERLTAYIRVAAMAATRAELHMLLDSTNTKHAAAWDHVLTRWIPSRDTPGTNDSARIALLAADGLWVNEAIGSSRMSPDERAHAAEKIIASLP